MSKVIIFPNNDGGISVIHPSEEGLAVLGLEGVAQKDVPMGKPYKIIDSSDLPQSREFRSAWEADFSEHNGVGANYGNLE
jgi:hypothetical protein